jgi:hypothetical protein
MNYHIRAEFAKKKVSLIGSFYTCEQLLSRMKFSESKTQSRLTDLNLQNNLKVTAHGIVPNIDILVKHTSPIVTLVTVFSLLQNFGSELLFFCA